MKNDQSKIIGTGIRQKRITVYKMQKNLWLLLMEAQYSGEWRSCCQPRLTRSQRVAVSFFSQV